MISFRNRKASAFNALVISLLLSLLPLSAFSAQKIAAGAACTSLNKKVEYQKKIFTCVKSGKKLVWNKGVAIKVAAPKATPTPVSSPSASSTAPAVDQEDLLKKPCSQRGIERTTFNLFVCTLTEDLGLIWIRKGTESQYRVIATPTPTPTPSSSSTPKIQLPADGSKCTKIGEKIFDGTNYMKCSWAGHANTTEEAINKSLIWRNFVPTTISTSKSNKYPATPVEDASCSNSGDTWDVSGGILECRWINGKKLKWVKVNTKKTTFTNAKSPVSIETCKIQNSAMTVTRGDRDATQFSGFPLLKPDYMSVKGTNEVLIVPVDFPDFPGGNELKAQLDYDIKWLVDWYDYFSNGQSKFNVTTIDRWIRLPKDRTEYPTDEKSKDGLGATSNFRQSQQAQAFIDEVTKYFDLRKFSTVYLFFPDGNWAQGDLIVRNQIFKIKEGQVILNFFSWGRNLEGMETLKWSYYIHETLHDLKINGHAPGNGWPFNIMTNQSGISLTMNPWEQFLLDWLPAEQIYCDDISTLKTATVSLSPIEREDKQTKMAVIKLSATKVIVVESHGIDKWSDFNVGDRAFPPGFYSVMAYVVDLNKTVAPPVNSDGSSQSNDDWAWAVWQKVDGTRSNEFNNSVGEGKILGDYVAVLGDTFTIEGVKIKFVATGDYETVEISKA